MGLDIAERRRLAGEVNQDAREKNMLEDVGEIAGVKIMRVIHKGISHHSAAGTETGPRGQ